MQKECFFHERNKGMKIALINPKGTIFSRNPQMKDFLIRSEAMGSFRTFWSAPCLGILAISPYIPEDWEIIYIDENYVNIDFDIKFDIVCLSAMTVQAKRAYEIAGIYKEKGILTVLGGIHATILPQEACKYVDVVIAGEGEVLFPLFIQDYMNQTIKPLYKESQQGHRYELSKCVSPKYELLKGYDYPLVNLYTTRGCPRKCSFCCASNVYGSYYRRKTNKQILNEIYTVIQAYPDKLLLFADDNFFVLKQESIELLKEIKKLNIRWIAQTDIAIADDPGLLKLMYESGCQWIVIGFESVSDKSISTIETVRFKEKYINHYSERIKQIQSYGIKIYGTFIVGLDRDEIDIFDRTAEFILQNNLYGANITVPTPLPGTVLRDKMLSENRIINYDWSYYTLWDVVIKPVNMGVRELEKGLLHVYETLLEEQNTDKRLRTLFHDIKNAKKGIKNEA